MTTGKKIEKFSGSRFKVPDSNDMQLREKHSEPSINPIKRCDDEIRRIYRIGYGAKTAAGSFRSAGFPVVGQKG